MKTIIQVFNSRIQKHGSFEDFMIEFARETREKKINLTFVFPKIETEEVKRKIESLGASVYIIKESWLSFKFIIGLLKIILKEKPQILDFHFCYSLNFVFLFFILYFFGRKVVYHYHGEIRPLEELKFVNRHFSTLRLLTLFVNIIVCVSEANKRFLKALNINKKICVIYNGVDVKSFTNVISDRDFKKEIGFTNGELIITSIGSLIPRKGMNVLIKAAKYVIENVPRARFVIIGGGNKDGYLKLAEDLGIKDKVILTGLIKDYPYHILKATDLFVSASFAESFGLSIAEAQILGIPVVATEVGGVPEVVQDGKTGVLVSSGDSKSLAEAMTKVLCSKELRKEFSEAGKEWVREQFNLEDKVKELLDVCFS